MEDKNKNMWDYKEIIHIFIKNKKLLGLTFLISAVLGIVVSKSLPKNYTAKITLAPESNEGGGLAKSLGSLSSLAGISLPVNSTDAYTPEIYPDVVMSTTFLVELSKIKIKTIDNIVFPTLYEYIENGQKSPWWSAWIPSDNENTGKHINAFRLSKEQYKIIKSIGNTISCSVGQDDGVITIKAQAQDPLAATIIADSVSNRLQKFITDYRTNKVCNDLRHIERLYDEAKQRYEKARLSYSRYADANQDAVLESVRTKTTDLENEMQLQYNLYTQATTQLEMARAKVIEKTPVFAELQSATVPVRHSSPKTSLVTLGFIFVGMSIMALRILAKEFISKK